ncbi:MAG: molybdopterin-dependent oxidoreductase [Acidobacteria bacterium]|nr:molybdopterin-dependent oxidoreductase [Acidobacteriota bacterium]
MAENVTLTIDGQKVQAPKGTMLIEAARTVGISIPHYCYHSGLPVVGSCRMCLIEIEKNPKLQPSCATPVAEGMVVRTRSPEALRNRRSVLEFLLANHPLDCPVCDQSGECELQNYYMEHGLYDTRYNDNKTKRKKAYPIGPHIILDQERCILCTRCVRFTRYISKTSEMGVMDRGHRSEINVFPGFELANRYSGNLADVCPVGALTDRDFRFKCRVWFLGSAPSICPGCSRGCNIEIHFNERFNPRYHDQRVHRLKPRFNEAVNGHWICDEGRYAYHSIDAPNRLRIPQMKRGDAYQETSWTRAVQEAAASLRNTLATHGPQGIAVLASPQLSNEELFLISRIFGDNLGIERIESRVPTNAAVYSDDFLITADKNPNTRGTQLLLPTGSGSQSLLKECVDGNIHFLYIFQHDLTVGYDPAYVMEALGKVKCVVFQGSWNHATAALSDIQLPSAVYAEKEGTFTNIQGRVQRFLPAVAPISESLPDLDILARLAVELGISLRGVTAAEVLEEIGQSAAAFAGMTRQTVGSSGQLIAPISGE